MENSKHKGIDRVFRLQDVLNITGLKRSNLYDLISKGMFPMQISLGPRSVGWLSSEIFIWQQDRIQERDNG